jgi:signal transduction histidine kinase
MREHRPPVAIGLSPAQLAATFPFHFAFDRDLRLVQVGPAMMRIGHDVVADTLLDAHFRLQAPDVPLSFAALGDRQDELFLLEHLRTGLVLRGRMLADRAAGTMLFLGAPRVVSAQEMRSFGLVIDDFPPNAPMAELLEAVARHEASLATARESIAGRAAMNAELRQTVEELRRNLAVVDAAAHRRHVRESGASRRGDARAESLQKELEGVGTLFPDPLVILRAGAGPAYANSAFQRLTMATAEALEQLDAPRLDRLLAELGDPAQPPAPVLSLGAQGSDTFRLRRPKQRHIQRTVRGLGGTSGAPASLVVHLHDLGQDAAGGKMPAEFLALAAHELRTPISSIVGFSELLLAREFDAPTRRDLLETIHRQSALLVNMITKLLDLARVEARAGRDFRIRDEPLAPIVAGAVAELLNPDERHRIVIKPPAGPTIGKVDADRLLQSIRNVVENACKFSPGGEPVVIAFTSGEDGARPMVGVTVRDRGIGMTRDQAARVFDRFYRADPSGPIPGTGLGLPLVKEVMDLL